MKRKKGYGTGHDWALTKRIDFLLKFILRWGTIVQWEHNNFGQSGFTEVVTLELGEPWSRVAQWIQGI